MKIKTVDPYLLTMNNPRQLAQRGEEALPVPEEFESIFLRQILKQSRESLSWLSPKEEDSEAKDIYNSLWEDQLATLLSQQNCLGISQIIKNYLTRSEDRETTEKQNSAITHQ